jgi:hypothetical protein
MHSSESWTDLLNYDLLYITATTTLYMFSLAWYALIKAKSTLV